MCLNCAHAGKAVVKCSATQMTVSLEKISMDGIDKNWLNMNDPSCSMSSNATHIMATMSFNTCGTKLEVCFNIKGEHCIIVGFYIDVDTRCILLILFI